MFQNESILFEGQTAYSSDKSTFLVIGIQLVQHLLEWS